MFRCAQHDRVLRRLFVSLGRIAVVTFFALLLLILFFQHRMIYFPRHYSPAEIEMLARISQPLTYRTSQGEQTAYYIGARENPPRRLWAMFCGNGSVAADWLETIQASGNPHDAFLLVDYPGYGASAGAASPKSIAESAEAAAQLALQKLPHDAALPWGAMGHSLGCAAALQFAVKFKADRVILVSPFTSMTAMARRQVGWPLCLLLRHPFDNVARLDELTAHSPHPRVTIFHGLRDNMIPPSMGRQLAEAHPDFTRFEPVENAGHNDVVTLAAPRLVAAISE